LNEIILSNDLNQIELEINHHKNIAGQSIWEIGRRLNHVKENDLAHGQFMNWCEVKLGITSTQANKYMKVANEFSNSNSDLNLGVNALYLISTLPEEEKQKELSKAETGDPSTVRELRELKKQLKEKDQQLKEKENQVNQLHNQILNTQPQRVKTKEVVKEVKPADYDDLKSDNQQLQEVLKTKENQFQSLRTQYHDLINQRSEVDEKSKKYDELNEAIKKMQGQLDKGQQEIAAQKEVYDLVRKSKELIAEVAPLTYLIDAENIISNEYAKRPLIEIANKLHDIADKIEKQVENTNIIEGEIING